MTTQPTSPTQSTSQASALIVDDEPYIRELYRLMLESLGYKVTEVGDGDLALALLERQTFNLMVLDLQMPTMSGRTVLRTVRQMFIHDRMKIAIVTAQVPMANDEIHAIADHVMFKPMIVQDFIKFATDAKDGSVQPVEVKELVEAAVEAKEAKTEHEPTPEVQTAPEVKEVSEVNEVQKPLDTKDQGEAKAN